MLPAAVPSIVTWPVIVGSEVVGVIVELEKPRLNSILSTPGLAFASRIACRNVSPRSVVVRST